MRACAVERARARVCVCVCVCVCACASARVCVKLLVQRVGGKRCRGQCHVTTARIPCNID